jgi:hypothetical protein
LEEVDVMVVALAAVAVLLLVLSAMFVYIRIQQREIVFLKRRMRFREGLNEMLVETERQEEGR